MLGVEVLSKEKEDNTVTRYCLPAGTFTVTGAHSLKTEMVVQPPVVVSPVGWWFEFVVSARAVASLPSSWSALRLATLVVELTFMGASPLCTLKFTALSLASGLLFTTCIAEPLTLPVSLVTAVAVLFREPRMKLPPLAPKAVEATPSTNASITARPTRNTVALPTHITLLAALLIMLRSLSFAPAVYGDEHRANAPPRYVTGAAYSFVAG